MTNTNLSRLCLAAPVLLAIAAAGPKPQARDALEIGSRLELAADPRWVESMKGVQLRLHPPHPAETVLRPGGNGYMTVLKDGDLYRAYYRVIVDNPKEPDGHEFTCYAESADGINWKKPDLGLFTIPGSADRNAITEENKVAPGDSGSSHFPCISHNFRPFVDARPGVPADERFKALGAGFNSLVPKPAGFWALASGDGVRWRKLRDDWVIDRKNWPHGTDSTPPGAFWSDSEKKYVAYIRIRVNPQDPRQGQVRGKRWVGRLTSEDFVRWSNVVPMEMPDDHYYTNETHPYFRNPDLYLALPARFHAGSAFDEDELRALPPEMKEKDVHPAAPDSGFNDVVLLTTRGNDNAYRRPFEEAFLRPGLNRYNWGDRSTYPCSNIVPTGAAEMSMYVRHGTGPYGFVQRYTMRADGFASVQASLAGGDVVTRPLTFKGRRLTVNFSTSGAGGLRVEVQDAEGRPLAGFTMEDSVRNMGDSIDRVVRWKAGADVGALAGKTVRLKFALKDADLYAFRFTE